MSLTISELEAERAKILDEIENKAHKISDDPVNNPEQPSLKDWLNAAEEVMPTSTLEKNTMRKKVNSKPSYQSQISKQPKNKAPFFGVLIMLTLLLTLIGVLYIAYTSIHKELQNVLATNQQSVEQMAQIQVDMDSLQKSISTGGKADLFIALEDKVFALESQVKALQNQIGQLQTLGAGSLVSGVVPSEDSVTEQASANPDKLVTEAVLDEKLQSFTNKLEKKIDQKLEAILNYISQGKPVDYSTQVEQNSDEETKDSSDRSAPLTVNEPASPTITATKEPVIKQPLVQLIKKVEAPKTPAKTEAPIENFTADVKWLMTEPAMHYTLQLASMPDESSLQKMANKKQLRDIRILPQTRNDVTNYVLITGSFSDRNSATQLAKEIKSEFGISPWIRKIKDLSSRVK